MNLYEALGNAKHAAVSLNNAPDNLRKSGKCYLIVTDLRKNTIKYIAEDLTIRSSNKHNFKILNKKYIDILTANLKEKINDNINR